MGELKQVQWLRVERGLSVVLKRGQGSLLYHWKAKGQCSKGDKCSFRHDSDERAKSTPEHTALHTF